MKHRIERKSVEEILFRTFSASDWEIWLIVSLIGNRQPFSVIWSILEKPNLKLYSNAKSWFN